MKGPSLQKTAALSTVLHVTVVLLAVMMTRQSTHMALPSPYIVDLIGPASEPRESHNSDVAVAAPADTAAAPMDNEPAKKTKETKIDEKRIDNAIAAMEAKKKIADRSRLKRRMRDIKSGNAKPTTKKTPAGKISTGKSAGHSNGAPGVGSYPSKVQSEIRQYWKWPDTAEKNLEMIVTVKIMRDGSITPIDIKKKSGNPFFDRTIINAIRKANPVTPPPDNEIGNDKDIEADLRFFI